MWATLHEMSSDISHLWQWQMLQTQVIPNTSRPSAPLLALADVQSMAAEVVHSQRSVEPAALLLTPQLLQ